MSKTRKCPECRGDVKLGKTQLTYELRDVKISIKNVTASVCQNCKLAFISPPVASDVNRLVNRVTEDINSFVKSQPDMALKKTKRKIAIAV